MPKNLWIERFAEKEREVKNKESIIEMLREKITKLEAAVDAVKKILP
jgi:hypothetical protein